MPSWAPSDEQLQSFYDRAQDRADGETPVDALPVTRFHVPDAPRPSHFERVRDAGYEAGDPKGYSVP
jgi:hypothetical protein